MYDEDGLYRINPERGKIKFSKIEVRDILISMVVLAAAFTILYRSGSILDYFAYHFGEDMKYVGLFAMCFGLVIFSFLLHELGHKFTAQRAGLYSEYRMYPIGLFIRLLTSLIGFLFAMPGAVNIAGQMDQKTYAKISLAGPVVNIILAAVGIVGALALDGKSLVVPFLMLGSLNSILALFNMLPIPPLDGSKIVGWNLPVYIVVIAIAAAEFAYVMFYMPELRWA
jgi:Zn-dependent protease